MPKRALVLAGDYYHPASVIMDGLVGLGCTQLSFEPGSIDLLSEFDILIVAKANAVSPESPSPWTCAETDKAIDKFVREGAKAVFVHAGTVGYAGLLREMAGGAFRHHPEACQVRIEPNSSRMMLEPFEVFDEHYLMDFDGDSDVQAYSVSESGREPAVWIRNWGKGEVKVLTPGHYPKVWQHPEYQRLTSSFLSGLL